ncbi:unnamed protein product [Lampetra planeri]
MTLPSQEGAAQTSASSPRALTVSGDRQTSSSASVKTKNVRAKREQNARRFADAAAAIENTLRAPSPRSRASKAAPEQGPHALARPCAVVRPLHNRNDAKEGSSPEPSPSFLPKGGHSRLCPRSEAAA